MNAATRSAVRARAGGRCEYCLLPQQASEVPLHVEHIRARQHSGTDELANLALACDRCIRNKGPNLSAVDPASGEVTALFDPRVHRWDEHFRREGATIAGLTPLGRATASLLKFNDPVRLRLRATLREFS